MIIKKLIIYFSFYQWVYSLHCLFLHCRKMIYNETCTANWVIFNDQGRANLTIDFMFNKKNKTGTVALSGTWQQGNRESKSIRRNIEYTWIENYDTAHLTSKKVNKFEIMDQVDDDRLVQLIPDFYVFPEKV